MDIRKCQVHNVRENEQIADNIVDVARTLKADLIVMGAKSSPPRATHLASGVLAKVLAEAPCPILSIHAG
jgi:nucleotide-binding universal stress UspA family protein